jgi:putative ABC transport system ATP-binding protein
VTASQGVVSVVGVSKRYPAAAADEVRALDDVTFDVNAGEMVAVMGPSGCGKTTLLNLIGCVDLPTSGAVVLDGRATSDLDDDALTTLRRDRVGTVFQFFNLLPSLTIAENVGFPLVLQRRQRDEIERRVRVALEAVGIADKAGAYPAQASGGQLQRAAVARATIHRPAIVLADEPTGNLDSRNGADVLRLLHSIAGDGQAILLATHSSEAASACDRTIHLQDGRIVDLR